MRFVGAVVTATMLALVGIAVSAATPLSAERALYAYDGVSFDYDGSVDTELPVADAYVALATKADLGGPYCVTSGCIPNSVLDQIQVVTMNGMDAVFLPNELLPFIDDLSLPSPP